MCVLHCGICSNCNSCSSGTNANFSTRNLDFGYSTRLPPLSYVVYFLFKSCDLEWYFYWTTAHFFSLLLSTAFLIYVAATVSIVLALILHFEPHYGQTNILVYLGICSLVGALTVIAFLMPYYEILRWHAYLPYFMENFCLILALYFECYHVGSQYKGYWYCNKAYFGGDQSNWISPDLVFLFSCSNLCDRTVKLSQQGSHIFIKNHGNFWCF